MEYVPRLSFAKISWEWEGGWMEGKDEKGRARLHDVASRPDGTWSRWAEKKIGRVRMPWIKVRCRVRAGAT